MKKLILKKDVVARINSGAMQQLRGGAGTMYTIGNTCGPTCVDTCNKNTCAATCDCTTGPQNPTCMQSCFQEQTCPGHGTCDATACAGTCQAICGGY